MRRSEAKIIQLLTLSLLVVGEARALGPILPIPDTPVLSDSSVRRLDRGDGAYQYDFDFTAFSVDAGWQNKAGDTITVMATIEFGPEILIDALQSMFVIPSIRLGRAPVSCPNLAPGGLLPFSSFAVVPSSAGGDVLRMTTATDSQTAGESQVCNAEDANGAFASIVFDGTKSAYDFSFQIAQAKDDVDLDEFGMLRPMIQAYVAPEPGTGVLALLGLAGLGVAVRCRRKRD